MYTLSKSIFSLEQVMHTIQYLAICKGIVARTHLCLHKGFLLLFSCADGPAGAHAHPCLAPSLLFHCLLHCLVCVNSFTIVISLPPSYPSSLPSHRTLPIVLIMIPFGVLSAKYQLVKKADDCSCRWDEAKQIPILSNLPINLLIAGVCHFLEMCYRDHLCTLLGRYIYNNT